MSDAVGSLTRRTAFAVCLTLAVASRAAAQPPLAAPPSTPQFMSRYDFHLSAAALSSSDPRFAWDTHFGGDMDVADYVRGRTTLLADYQAVLGSEFRAFDPNQGNYTLEASSSVRFGGTEVVGIFHHVSRHSSDRPKRLAIAWNDVDVAVLRQFSVNETAIDVRVSAGKIVARAYVDYAWIGNLDLAVRRRVSPHVGVYGRATGEAVGIDAERSTRRQQTGGRLEGGIRLIGQAGVIELFAGYERVIDADPFDQLPSSRVLGGFRLTNR